MAIQVFDLHPVTLIHRSFPIFSVGSVRFIDMFHNSPALIAVAISTFEVADCCLFSISCQDTCHGKYIFRSKLDTADISFCCDTFFDPGCILHHFFYRNLEHRVGMFVHHRGRHQLSVFRKFFSVQAAVHPVPFVTSPHTQFHTMAGQFPVHSFVVGDRRMKGFGLTGVSTGRSCQVAFCSCNRCIGCGSTKIQQGIVPGKGIFHLFPGPSRDAQCLQTAQGILRIFIPEFGAFQIEVVVELLYLVIKVLCCLQPFRMFAP